MSAAYFQIYFRILLPWKQQTLGTLISSLIWVYGVCNIGLQKNVIDDRADDNCLVWQEKGLLNFLNNGCFRCIFLIYF